MACQCITVYACIRVTLWQVLLSLSLQRIVPAIPEYSTR